jgi:hypothetical protein
VKSASTPSEIKDVLKKVVDTDDKIIVVELKYHWATYNISKSVTDWMKEHI